MNARNQKNVRNCKNIRNYKNIRNCKGIRHCRDIWNCKDAREYVKKLALAVLIALLCIATIPVYAAETTKDINQIVFLLDGSKSMDGERWQEALDSVLTIAAMLPDDYQTALIIYSENVDIQVGFDQSLPERIPELRETGQRGYTNTGEALETALTMFNPDTSGQKRVVIISDGEISMRTQEETQAASERYDNAVRQTVAEGVTIDILLYETEEIEEQITQGADQTEGFVFRRTEYNTAELFSAKYLFDQLGLARIMLGSSDSSDSFSGISLQDTYADRVKILLTAGSRIEDIHVACQSKEVQMIQGEKCTVVILDQPMEEIVDLQYTLAEKGRMNAFLVKEYSLTVTAEAAFQPEINAHRIQVNIVDSSGKDIFENENIRNNINIRIDGEKVPFEVRQGKAYITCPSEVSRTISLFVDLSGLNSIVDCQGAERDLWLEVPLPEEPEEEPDYLLIAILALCAFLVLAGILIFVLYLKRSRPVPAPAEDRPEPSKYSYTGMLKIYITRTRSGYDIPPLSFNLFRTSAGRVISLQEIIKNCDVKEEFPGAEAIYFKAAANRTLILTNNSDCTIIKNREILMKKQSYQLPLDSKVDISFEDEISELTFQYKEA